MKTLYININNEQIQSNEELEVLNYDLDSDFFFYLGEKVAKGCKVENENALITDFNTQDNEEDYKQIIAQWNELKNILFSEECEGKFELTLPSGFTHWLRYNEKYNTVYDRNFSHSESIVITIDMEELYEDSIEDLQRKILRKLQRDEFYLEIDEIVFNDDAVTRKSPIIFKIKDKYEGVGFKAYKKWSQENEMMLHSIPQICEKCKKNPCECNTKSISSDSFFPYKGFTLGETSMNDFKDDSIDDGYIIHYDLDNGVTLLGATEGDTFIAAMVDSKKSSNNKLPKEWSNLLGCRFGASHEKCRRALSEKDFDIILDSDADILVLSPNNKYRIHLFFDVNTSKFVAFLITLNECPYCNSKNFTFFVKPNTEIHMSCCVDCCRSYLPFEVESEELDEAEDEETLSCPNCSSDDVDDDGSDYLQYTCNDCGHNWGHDDTVECPECGSDDVENDGTDNLQYKCNACDHMWGEDEVDDNDNEEDYDDDTDSAGNQLSEYYEAFDVIIGKSTKEYVKRLGGVFVNLCGFDDPHDTYYKMPDGIVVCFPVNNSDIVNEILIHEEAKDNIPYFYKKLGIYWGINMSEFKKIFKKLGFMVAVVDDCYISAEKNYKNTSIVIHVYYSSFGMHSFGVSLR